MDVKDEQTSTVDIKETNPNEESKTTSSESKPSINSNTIQVEPKDVFQYEEAKKLWEERKVAECTKLIQQFLTNNPDHIEGRLLLVRCLAWNRRYEDAIREAKLCIQKDPCFAKAHLQLGISLTSFKVQISNAKKKKQNFGV